MPYSFLKSHKMKKRSLLFSILLLAIIFYACSPQNRQAKPEVALPVRIERERDIQEEAAIRVSHGRVLRQGDSLVFMLQNGNKKILTDNREEGGDFIAYRYHSYVPATGLYICE